MVARRSGDMVSIHVENYFAGSISVRDGLPVTTKPDAAMHGFGMKSMRMIVERYGGMLSCKTVGEVFHLNTPLPIPTGEGQELS